MNASLFVRAVALSVVLSCLAGCRSKDTEIFVSNVSAEEIISLTKARDQGPVSRFLLKVDGKIEGAAQLLILKDGKPHHVETLTGTVDARWSSDWTEDRVRLHYLPGPQVSGALRIRYRFVD